MIDPPFFSIVIPAFNRASLLKKSMSSVTQQVFQDWELIVVDDGSTDNTETIVREFKDPRVNYIYQENSERSAARNNGIRNSTGRYICFLDSDDEYLDNHLQTLYYFVERNHFPVGMIFTDTLWNGNISNFQINDNDLYSNPVAFFLRFPVGSPRVCIHCDILKKYKYDEEIYVGEDVVLWIPIAVNYPIYHIPKVTLNCLLHENSTVHLSKHSAVPGIKAYRKILNQYNSDIINRKLKKEILSNLYYRYAKQCYVHRSFLAMCRNIFISFILFPLHRQNKAKLYLIKSYAFGPKIDHF